MNIASLLIGEPMAEIGMTVASKIFAGIMKNNSSFSSVLDNVSGDSKTINLEDMNLSEKEEFELYKIREMAMNKGLGEIEVLIDGSRFSLNVKENTLTAIVS